MRSFKFVRFFSPKKVFTNPSSSIATQHWNFKVKLVKFIGFFIFCDNLRTESVLISKQYEKFSVIVLRVASFWKIYDVAMRALSDTASQPGTSSLN